MSLTRKFAILILSLILVLSFGLIGCSSNTTSPTTANRLTPSAVAGSPTATLSTQDIISKAVEATSKLTSSNYDLGMTMNMAGTIAGQPQNINVTANGTGAVDVSGKKVQMTLNMDMSLPGAGKVSVPVSIYYLDNVMYIQTMGQWMKQMADPSTSGFNDNNQADAAIKMLSSAIKVDQLSDETVSGLPCYVLQVNPDLVSLSAWIKSFQQMTDVQSGDPNLDFSKFVKNLSIKEWVTKDNFYLKKFDVSLNINVNQSDIETPTPGVSPASTPGNDQISMDIAETMTLTGYNQLVNITLPPEALNAQDITGQQPGQ